MATSEKQAAKIYWDEEERNFLLKTVWRTRRLQPNEALTTLLKKAQEQLPTNRRRPIKTIENFPWLLTGLRELAKKEVKLEEELKVAQEQIKELQYAQPRSSPTPLTKEQVLDRLDEEEILNRFTHTVMKNLSLEDLLLQHPTEQILAAIPLPKTIGFVAEHLTEAFGGGFWDVLNYLTKPMTSAPVTIPLTSGSTPTTPTGNGKLTTPRVLLIGAKPEQGNWMREKLKGKVELNTLDKNRKKDVPRGYDCYLIWTRFSSHALQDAVKKAAAPNQIALFHGGLERMTKRVLDFFGIN